MRPLPLRPGSTSNPVERLAPGAEQGAPAGPSHGSRRPDPARRADPSEQDRPPSRPRVASTWSSVSHHSERSDVRPSARAGPRATERSDAASEFHPAAPQGPEAAAPRHHQDQAAAKLPRDPPRERFTPVAARCCGWDVSGSCAGLDWRERADALLDCLGGGEAHVLAIAIPDELHSLWQACFEPDGYHGDR